MSGNKFLAISAIALVAVMMGMSMILPMVMATHEPSHKNLIYREEVCRGEPGDSGRCIVVLDLNNNKECDDTDPRIQIGGPAASRFPECP